jgi:hypothetical protein
MPSTLGLPKTPECLFTITMPKSQLRVTSNFVFVLLATGIVKKKVVHIVASFQPKIVRENMKP